MFLIVYFEKNMYVLRTYVTPPSLMHILALCCFTHSVSLGTPAESDPHEHKSRHSSRGSVTSGSNNITKFFFFPPVFIFLRSYFNVIIVQSAVPETAQSNIVLFPIDFCLCLSHAPVFQLVAFHLYPRCLLSYHSLPNTGHNILNLSCPLTTAWRKEYSTSYLVLTPQTTGS